MSRRGKKRIFIIDLSSSSKKAFRLSEEKKQRALTATFIIAVLLIAVGFLPKDVNAFSLDVHDSISKDALPFLAHSVLDQIYDCSIYQDSINNWWHPRHHFLQCRFDESHSYINEEYAAIQEALSKEVPDLTYAADRFGMLLHTVQDFYAHSNWVDIWVKRGYYDYETNINTTSDHPSTYILYEPGLDFWFSPVDDWSLYPYRPLPPYPNPNGEPYYRDIMIAQTSDPYYIPADYWVYYSDYPWILKSVTPEIRLRANEWVKYDALMTTAGGRSYKPMEMEHESLCKDNPDYPGFVDAFWNAVAQTRHEFWRLLNLTKGTDYKGSCAILAHWIVPDEFSIGEISPAPLTATVSITNLTLTGFSNPDFNLSSFFVLAREQTGNFKSCVKSRMYGAHPGEGGAIDPSEFPTSLTLSLDTSDTLVMAVEPWKDKIPSADEERTLPGATLWLKGSDLRSGSYHLTSANLDAWLSVTVTAAPVAEAGGPYTGVEGTPVTFSAAGSLDFDGSITGYEWDFDGDGEYSDGTGLTVNHTWVDDFTGTVGLRVTDNEGLTGTDTAYISIGNVPPTVEAGADIATYPGQSAVFTGTYTDPGLVDTHTFEIHWGDGFINTGPASGGSISLDHVYSEANTFLVTLTVTDDDGGSGTDTLTVKVMTAEEGAQSLSDDIQDLSSDAFKNSAEQRKIALSAKMDVVIRLIQQEKYQEALDKLILDIRRKTDGFWGGDPSDDWITDSAVQQELLAMIDALVSYIQTLL